MDASSVVIILSVLSTVASASSLPRAALFPIVECPDDDTPYPQVILIPSVGGVQLAANQYVVCFKGLPQIFNCSEGLFFNWSKMSCDLPYERSIESRTNDTSALDGILDLIPVGPIPIPTSPQESIPFSPDRRRLAGNYYPVPPFPITRPNPAVLPPIPVLSPRARPPPYIPSPNRAGERYPVPPYPITKPNPDILSPISILPAHPPPLVPRPVPYYYYEYYY